MSTQISTIFLSQKSVDTRLHQQTDRFLLWVPKTEPPLFSGSRGFPLVVMMQPSDLGNGDYITLFGGMNLSSFRRVHL